MSKRKQPPTLATRTGSIWQEQVEDDLFVRDSKDTHLAPVQVQLLSKPPALQRTNVIKPEPLVAVNEATVPIKFQDIPSPSSSPIIQQKKTVKRDEVMEQGRQVLDKLGWSLYNQRDLIDEMNACLDEHKVRVLTEKAKGKVYVWGMRYDRKFTFWVHRAYEDLKEYSYTDNEEATQPLLAWRDMIKEPLREMNQIAAEVGGYGQRRILHAAEQLKKGLTWLDWQEQRRHAQREAAADEEKCVRGEFAAAVTKLTISHGALNVYNGKLDGKLDELLRKTDRLLGAIDSKDARPSKKQRVGQAPTSSKREEIAKDVQILVDTLTFNLTSSRAAFGQMEKVLKHFDMDVAKDIDYDRERCLARRRQRISDMLGSDELTMD